MKKLMAIVLAMVLVIGLAGISAKAETNEENIVKMAFLFPLSGAAANVGEDSTKGVKVAVEYINSHGGIKSLNGAKIEMIYADTQSNEENAASEAERLINNEGVSAIIGCYQSAVSAAVQTICEKYEVPLMICCSSGNFLTEGNHPYSYRIIEANDKASEAQLSLVKMLKEQYGDIETAAVLYQNDDWGQDFHDNWTEGLKEMGIEIVVDDVFSAFATDMTATVSKLIDAKPDVILHSAYLDPAVMFLEGIAGRNWSTKVIIGSSAGEVDPDFIPTVGDVANGTFSCVGWNYDVLISKNMTWVADEYAKMYPNEVFSTESRCGWVDTFAVYQAIENCGSKDPKEINAALKALKVPFDEWWNIGAYGIEFDQTTGQNIHAIMLITQFQDQNLTIVYPDEVRLPGVELVYPTSKLSPISQ